jgi:phytoene dehydrogenase-like protein
MSGNYDIVVAGGGHNSLVASAYLAAAGLKVLVLEKNDWLGGGVVTRELTVPGFKQDLHSTVHMLTQANPLIRNDELKLMAKFGLKYIKPDVSVATIFDDGTAVLTYHDLDKTCEDMAKISPRDAESYRKHCARSLELMPMFTTGLFAPPAPFGTFLAMLEQSKLGRDLIGVMNKSAFDIVDEMFESEKLKVHFLKFASEAMSGPEEKGTGLVFSMLVGWVHAFHGGFPEGGSGALCDALVRCIEHHGGATRIEANVTRVLIEGGKAVGVELEDGEQIRARKAVIGCFHPHLLRKFVTGVNDQVLTDAERTHPAGYTSFIVNYALNSPPVYPAIEGLPEQPMMIELLSPSLLDLRREFDNLRYGVMNDDPNIVCFTHSNLDATRAPPGKATLYQYSFAPYSLADGGPQAWDRVRDQVADSMLKTYRKFATNIEPDNIIARHISTPLDNERWTPSFQKGDIMGIGRYLYQFLGRRPTPELSQYTVPGVDGLYLCGPFMHPGGGVIGGGRAVAVKMMGDLGLDFDKAVLAA